MSNVILESSDDPKAIQFYGGNRDAFLSDREIVILVGSAGSGKTYALCCWLHLVLVKYPGTRALLCRKSLPSLRNSAVKTFQQVLKDFGYVDKVRVMGESRPTNFVYPEDKQEWNGKEYKGKSEIVLSQIDDSGKILGAEYDIVYINQPDVEGVTYDQFIQIHSRARLTNCPYSGRLICDPNPSHDRHFLIQGKREGKWDFYESNHKDNPQLFNHHTGEWTEEGKRHLERLERLPEHLKQSQLHGMWFSLEGTIFEREWRDSFILAPASSEAQELGIATMLETGEIIIDVPNYWDHYVAIDYGNSTANPFVALLIAQHPITEQFIIYKHIYTGEKDIFQCAELCKEMTDEINVRAIISDRGRAEQTVLEKYLKKQIITAKKGNNSVEANINICMAQLNEGKWRFLNTADSLIHEPDEELKRLHRPQGIVEEIPSLKRDEKTGGVAKNQPDHAFDAWRYFCRWYAEETGGYKKKHPLIFMP